MNIREACTTCNNNYCKTQELYDLKAVEEAFKNMPPEKVLPVFLDGVPKGFIRVRKDFSNNNGWILEAPKGFSEWMNKATFGEPIDCPFER